MMTERSWIVLILATSCIVLLATIYCLSRSITIIFMHLYYIPIILLAYRYRRSGLWAILLLSLLYLVLVAAFLPGDYAAIQAAAARVFLFIGVGVLGIFISENLEKNRDDFQYGREIQKSIIQNANVWMMVLDAEGRVLEWNAAAEDLSGYASGEVKGRTDIWKRLYPKREYRGEVARQINTILSRRSYLENFSTTITTKNGDTKNILWNTRELPHPKSESPLYIGVGVDITDQKKAEDRIRLQAVRTQKLLELDRMKDASFSGMLAFSLEACLKMTESHYSFIGLMTSDESVMSIHSWSRDVMEECAITDKALDFPITSTGVLGECVRQRAPFVLNDYSAPHPAKHGCPEGHVPITRFLSVPLFDGEKIVAVIAVANKEDDYGGGDIDALTTLGNHMWELLHRREAEEALKKSEEIYRAFFSTSRDCVFITTIDGHFIDFNEEAVRLLGYENREDLMGRPVTDVYADPVGRDRHIAFISEHGYSKEYPVRLRKKDGTIIDTLVTTVAVRDEKGNIVRFQGTIRDVTEQRRAEEELKFSNIILSTQQETSLDGILVVDDTGAVSSYNRRFVEMWNIPPDVLETRLDDRFLQSVLSLVTDPNDFLEQAKYLYEHHDLESREEITLIDGRTFDRYSAPMKGTDGSYYGRVWYFRDITERKRAEKTLRDNENLLTEVGGLARVGGVELDVESQEAHFSQEAMRIFDLVDHDTLKVPEVLLFFDEQDRYGVNAAMQRCIETGGPINFELPITTVKGHRAWIRIRGRRVSEEGVVEKLVGAIQDITELKQAEAALMDSEEQFRGVAERSSELIFLSDVTGKATYVSPSVERILGYTPEEILGKTAYTFIAEEDHEAMTEVVRKNREGLSVENLKTRIRKKDGNIAFMELSMSPIMKDGIFSGIQVIGRDITERKRADEKLRESEEKFRRYIENAPIGVFITDDQGRWLDVNPAASTITGYSPEELLNMRIPDILAPQVLDEAMEHFQKLVETGHDSIETMFVHKSGEVKYWAVDAVRISQNRLLGLAQDITGEKLARERITELLRIINTSPAIAFLWRAEENWPVETVSENITQFGYTPEDFLSGRTRYSDIIHPGDLGRVTAEVEYNSSHGIDEYTQQYRIYGGDGKEYWIDDYTHIRRDNDGRITHYEGIILDITERKQAEEALRMSEQRSVLMLNAMPDMIFIVSREGEYTYFNIPNSYKSPIHWDKIVGSNIRDIGFPPDVAEKILQQISQALETKKTQKLDYEIVFPTEPHYYEARTQALNDEEVLAIVRDITEQKQAEELQQNFTEELEQQVENRTKELKASLQEKEVLLREVHHRVKNNLQIIISLINLQVRKAKDPDLKELLQETQGRIRAMSLVHEKLFRSEDLSRIDLSSYLHSLVMQLSASHGKTAAQKVTLHMEFDRIMTDINIAIPLGLVMNELISNALEHAFPGDMTGNVTIRGRMTNGEITVSVEDDGIGFPAGLDWRETPTLGLHLVLTLIRQLNGRIELVETGRGTVFSIIIPGEEAGETA